MNFSRLPAATAPNDDDDDNWDSIVPPLEDGLLPPTILLLLELRAKALAETLMGVAGGKLDVLVASDRAPVGGGSVPGFELDTSVVQLRGLRGPDRLSAALREAPQSVVARVRDDAVVLDMRTLTETDLEAVAAAVEFALGTRG